MKQTRTLVAGAIALALLLLTGCSSSSQNNKTAAVPSASAGAAQSVGASASATSTRAAPPSSTPALSAPASATPTRPAASSTASAGPAAAAPQNAGPKSFSAPPPLTIDRSATYLATITTEKGVVMVQLDAQAAPITVNNFIFLAQQHFYDGLTCHRVIPGFVAQCGDPNGNGSGGPGYTIPDEASPLKHDTGAIAMAKTNLPNSAGSQFYITLAPQPALDGKYTVFGHVVQGMDVVQRLTPRDPQTARQPGDRILSITISTR